MASASSTMLKTCWAADIVGYVMLVSLFRSFEIVPEYYKVQTTYLQFIVIGHDARATQYFVLCRMLILSQVSLYCYKSSSLMI